MSITDANALNKYEAHSSETYGETNFKQMREVIKHLEWNKDDILETQDPFLGA